jgi:5-methylthioadenosine/S-adenosylhomocysteine deaminase
VTLVLSADWVLPVEGPPIEDGAVAIEGSRIAAVGPASELGAGTRYEGCAILPGLVNAHTHVEYAVYGGFGDGLSDFSAWIVRHMERKGRIGFDEYVAIARLGVAESLRSGVTTVGDCSFSGAAAIACADLGLRAVVYLEAFGSDPEAALANVARSRERATEAWSESVQPGVSPHAPYSTSAEVYEACAGLGLPLATHLSESPSEVEYLLSGSGPWAGYGDLLVDPPGTTGTRMLESRGLLGPGLLAAHCVRVDSEEIGLLASRGAGVAHCPRSNAALGCGVAPLRELLDAGTRVGLGTDSPASAPSLDAFEELRAALLTARARAERPDALTPREALELATLGSARALGLDTEIGSLVPGKRADLAILDLSDSGYVPWEDPAAAVVFGGSPERIHATLVDGEFRYVRGEEKEWLEELRSSARLARGRMLRGTAARVPTGPS